MPFEVMPQLVWGRVNKFPSGDASSSGAPLPTCMARGCLEARPMGLMLEQYLGLGCPHPARETVT